jgi:hypothetical protein
MAKALSTGRLFGDDRRPSHNFVPATKIAADESAVFSDFSLHVLP